MAFFKIKQLVTVYLLFNVLQDEIQRKTGYIVMKEDGIFDVDANTSIDQLSEELNIKMPEVCIFILVIIKVIVKKVPLKFCHLNYFCLLLILLLFF